MLGVTQVAQRPWVGEQGGSARQESDYLELLRKPRLASSGGCGDRESVSQVYLATGGNILGRSYVAVVLGHSSGRRDSEKGKSWATEMSDTSLTVPTASGR